MVSVTIVTWNSAQYLDECFAALAAQDYRDLEVILVDNDSKDDTRKKLQAVEGKWRVIYNEHNEGFAEGQNNPEEFEPEKNVGGFASGQEDLEEFPEDSKLGGFARGQQAESHIHEGTFGTVEGEPEE